MVSNVYMAWQMTQTTLVNIEGEEQSLWPDANPTSQLPIKLQ